MKLFAATCNLYWLRQRWGCSATSRFSDTDWSTQIPLRWSVWAVFCVPEAKANAEADQIAKKANTFKEYREAAMVDMMLKVLPQVAAEISGPISQA